MEWVQSCMIAGFTIGACYWMHKENSKDRKDHNREMKQISEELKNESKEFHGRLCVLEERYLQIM